MHVHMMHTWASGRGGKHTRDKSARERRPSGRGGTGKKRSREQHRQRARKKESRARATRGEGTKAEWTQPDEDYGNEEAQRGRRKRRLILREQRERTGSEE